MFNCWSFVNEIHLADLNSKSITRLFHAKPAFASMIQMHKALKLCFIKRLSTIEPCKHLWMVVWSNLKTFCTKSQLPNLIQLKVWCTGTHGHRSSFSFILYFQKCWQTRYCAFRLFLREYFDKIYEIQSIKAPLFDIMNTSLYRKSNIIRWKCTN